MFIKKLSLKKLIFIMLFLLSSLVYTNWLNLSFEKRVNFLNLNKEVYINIIDSMDNGYVQSLKIEYFNLFSLYKNNLIEKDTLYNFIYDLELQKESLNYLDFLFLLNNENNSNYMISFIIHYILSSLFLIIGLLIAVAFFTLLERKVMASMQRRKGPNVVGF